MGLFHNQLSGPTDPVADAHWSTSQPRKGFFTDTSVCIGCKACEVACKEWNAVPAAPGEITGTSYDNTGALGADTWRHVAFVEQGTGRIAEARESGRRLVDLGMPAVPGAAGSAPATDGDGASAGGPSRGNVGPVTDDATAGSGATTTGAPLPDFRWLMSSDVCKHCTHAGCLDVCPTGALFRTEFGTVVVQADVCNGCGYCIPACPFGVIDRREGEKTVENHGTAQKCTLCYDRLGDGETPACAKACPTESIQFGDLSDMLAAANERVEAMHDRGLTEARLYGANPEDGVGGTGAVFLLLDEPETYGLPPDPRVPTADVARMFTRAGLAGLGMLAAAAVSFLGGRS